MKSISLFVLLLIFTPAIKAQSLADSLVKHIITNSSKIQTFSADVLIDVDVDFIRIPIKKGKIFFKSPDKFKFRATGFALVPKKGLNFSMQKMLLQPHTALYVSSDDTNHLIKIVPMTADADYVIASLWIDKNLIRINKMEITSPKQGNSLMSFEYGNLPYDLPVSTKVSFDIAQIDIPMQFMGNMAMDKKKKDKSDKTSGNVILNYSNFKINGEIPDTFFDEEVESDSLIILEN